MTLADFLGNSVLSQTGFARMAATTQKTISELASGTGRTNLATGVRIERASLGLVTVDEIPLHDEDAEALKHLRPNGPRKPRAA
jgi:hypothetical protein